ncbi:MAG: hypothetical protein KDH19_06700, partial [Geminicoccaceae bacterium]|nr:hypothetical protein [Geminicoccaceae bacterium]
MTKRGSLEVQGFDREHDVRILERREAHRGFFLFEELTLEHRRFDGSWSGPLSREVLHIPRAVCVLPYDPLDNRVVLIEQFRAGAIDHENGP